MESRTSTDRDTSGAVGNAGNGASLGSHQVAEAVADWLCPCSPYDSQGTAADRFGQASSLGDSYELTEAVATGQDMASGPHSPCIGWSTTSNTDRSGEGTQEPETGSREGQAGQSDATEHGNDATAVEDHIP